MGQIPSYFYDGGGMWDGTSNYYVPGYMEPGKGWVEPKLDTLKWLLCGICWSRVPYSKIHYHNQWHQSVITTEDVASLVKAECEKLLSSVNPTLNKIEIMLKQIEP